MANSTTFIFFFLFCAVPFVRSEAKAPGPAPGAEGRVNLSDILVNGSEFSIFIHLLNTTQVGNQVMIQLKSSNHGLTVVAPTDNAFNNLKPGALNRLTNQQQVQLLLAHITPMYYSFNDLLSVSNPVRTLATTGQDGAVVFGLNFTGQGNRVNVSTGLVETQINSNALRQEFPLAVYMVEMVLLPKELFGNDTTPSPSPAPAAPIIESPPPETETPSPNAEAPTEDKPKSGSGGKRGTMELGLVIGLAWLCFGLLSSP